MKDQIFIAWSGDNSTARKVKRMLEDKVYDYYCCVGGNDSNDSQNTSVGDTVIDQFKGCNQAIIIFQNKKVGEENVNVSQNLFFELGYALALYGMPKVHCVKRRSETIVLPSDFDNSFIESVDDSDDETYIKGIVDYFLRRQKMTLDVNKFDLINNRHIIREKILKHYSREGSQCSDYELAQYVLFYLLAAQLFRDTKNAVRELEEFRRTNHLSFSWELSLSIEFGISLLKMINSIQKKDDVIFISYDSFWEMHDTCEHVIRELENQRQFSEDVGDFCAWIEMYVYECMNYGLILYAQNPEEVDTDEKIESLKEAVVTAEKAFACIEYLEQTEICKKRHDDKGILALIRSYLSRNLFIAYSNKDFTPEENDEKHTARYWLDQALDIRSHMVQEFDGVLDSKLNEHFKMEYYLSICESLIFSGEKIDDIKKRRYKHEVKKYLEAIRSSQEENNVYINRIDRMYNLI